MMMCVERNAGKAEFVLSCGRWPSKDCIHSLRLRAIRDYRVLTQQRAFVRQNCPTAWHAGYI